MTLSIGMECRGIIMNKKAKENIEQTKALRKLIDRKEGKLYALIT